MRWQSQKLVDYYYGVEIDEALPNRPAYEPSDAWSFRFGLDLQYRLSARSYLTFNLAQDQLSDEVLDSPIVDDRYIFSAFLSYRYEFNNDEDAFVHASKKGAFATKDHDVWSYRVAAGYGTETSFNKIIRGDINIEPNRTQIASLLIGKQLTDSIFGTTWDAWVNGGLVRHFERGLQDDYSEYVLSIKTYYSNFPWKDTLRTRFGIAEGLSYGEKVSSLEGPSVKKKNRSVSHMLNYLDFSVDLNIGDLFNAKNAENCYFGWSIHHRSGIFSSSDFFGNVSGGSNYNTLYVECLVFS